MKKIDGIKVANETSKCGKRLKVNVVAGLLAEALETLENKNSVVKEVKEKCGEELFNEFEHSIMTFFALNLLAKTHNPKEFKELFENCQVEDNANA